jgi:iron complex outermembrane recepter protein
MTKLGKAAIHAGASLVALAAISAPALAQDAPQAEQDGGGIKDIVVTAQRRSENVLAVSLSITAISGDQLQTTGIKQISDIAFTTPGYNVSDASGYTQIFIRGIGNSIFVGADPSVASFIDDVPRIYGSLVNNFVDVERVEVLKGAQGGLYGRNATGGVVNIITRQPSTEAVKANARLSYGEHNTFTAAGYVNVTLGDKAAFSVSAERRSHDPYIKNIAVSAPYTAAMFPVNNVAGSGTASFVGTPAQTAALLNSGVDNRDVNNANFWAVGGKLLIKPSDNFKITFAADYSNKDDSSGNSLVTQTPGVGQGTLQFFLNNYMGASSVLPPNFVIGNTPKFVVANGSVGYVRLKDYGYSATAVLSAGDIDITSITAYRNQHTQFLDDLGNFSPPTYAANVDNHKHYWYQELRAVSRLKGPFQFVVGGSYLSTFFEGNTTGNILTPVPFLQGLPLAHSTDKVKNWSIYGQVSYDLTDALTLTASGRYIHESNAAHFFPDATNGFPARDINTAEEKFLPSATLSYKLAGGGNIYLRYARGFKSGGINPVAHPNAFSNINAGSAFKGEVVDTFEGGIRAPLANNKVQITTAVFYNNYKDLHFSGHAIPTAIILSILNAGTARTWGIEGSVNWRVAPPVTIGVASGYLNAKYKRFAISGNPDYVDFNFSGQRMTNSPEFQFSFTANVDQPITDNLRLVGSALVTHSSSNLWQQGFAPPFIPDATDPGYWLANARIGVKSVDDRWGLAVFADNVFNSRYTTYGASSSLGTQISWGNPRILGVEASFKY